MANLNKIDVPIAIEHKSKLDLSCDHVTTMSFMTTQPVNYRHMIRGEHINITAKSIVRPAPIEVPVYGMLRQNIRYFFVPYRLVFPNWDGFYNDVISNNYTDSSIVQSPPRLSNNTLVNLFVTQSNGLSTSTTDPTNFDFSYNGTNYNFTYLGRFIYKVLRSLGYEVLWSRSRNVSYNALALLAYCKIYVDWYANSQYLNSQEVLLFERLCKFNDPASYLIMNSGDLLQLLSFVRSVVYDTEDYFVNAWDNPVAPNTGQYTAFTVQDVTRPNSAAYIATDSGNGTPYMAVPSNEAGSTYLHDALKRLTDYQKRHALAGARSIDRVLAQYGMVSDSLKQSRSIYLGNQYLDIEIGSVYATADSTDGNSSSQTGDYAGAGFGQGSKTFDFHADEEGILLAIASIIPSGRLVQGYDRNNLHLQKSDFFVPEFDGLGVQAIERGEVYVSKSDGFVSSDTDYRKVFGFSGRYGEYKRPKSFLTGDVSLPNFLAGGSSWHLFRLFTDGSFGDVNSLVHSLAFTRGIDSGQYNRMFQYTLGDYDPFYCFIHFDIASYAPCRPLFETYDFESDSKQVPTENGNKVN